MHICVKQEETITKRSSNSWQLMTLAGTPEHILRGGLGISCKSIWKYATMEVAGRQ